MSEQLVADLAALLGAQAVRSGEAVAAMDPGWHPDNLKAGIVVSPASTAEVSKLLAWCSARGQAVVPQGGRTGLVGGGASQPGQIVLSLSRLAEIEALDVDARVAIAGAGVTLARLQQAAAEQGLDPGIDTPSRDSATVGGLISTNAGGIAAFRHGVMRHRVVGIEAVLSDGTVVGDLTQVLKNATGYDVKQLLIGAEGTLGVVTRAAIRLVPVTGPRASALIGVGSVAAALQVVQALSARTDAALTATELMSGAYAVATAGLLDIDAAALDLGAPVHLVIEMTASSEEAARTALEEGLAEVWEGAGLMSGTVAVNLRQRDQIWSLREVSDVFGRAYGLESWYDVSLPSGGIDAYIDGARTALAALDPELELHFIGHLGDGNLHVMVGRRQAPAVFDKAGIEAAVYTGLREQGGAFSAEHGVGLEKRDALERFADPGKLAAMRRLKQAFDPAGILNPGKVLR